MSATNVDYYCAGFDDAGKRVGSVICDFNPTKDKNTERVQKLLEEGKKLFHFEVKSVGMDGQKKRHSGTPSLRTLQLKAAEPRAARTVRRSAGAAIPLTFPAFD